MNYKVIERKDPRNPEAPGKYYGFIVNLSKIGIEEIATRISGTCTVTRHDCLAVLSALQEQIIYALQEGKRVHLGDIGSFRTVANGLGSDTAEKIRPGLHRQAPRLLHAQHQAQKSHVARQQGFHARTGGLLA